MDEKKFFPGSLESIAAGCMCPPFENYVGEGGKTSVQHIRNFNLDINCPLHVLTCTRSRTYLLKGLDILAASSSRMSRSEFMKKIRSNTRFSEAEMAEEWRETFSEDDAVYIVSGPFAGCYGKIIQVLEGLFLVKIAYMREMYSFTFDKLQKITDPKTIQMIRDGSYERE